MLRLCESQGYVSCRSGGVFTCDSPSFLAYSWFGVLDVSVGKVRLSLLVGPNYREALSEEYEEGDAVVFGPVLLTGPSRLVLECLEDGSVWYRFVALDISQMPYLSAIISNAL